MIPIPQYPIYSAILTRLGGQQVGYYLDEENNWSVSKSELELRLKKAKHSGLNVKALVIINPGNPTGQVFSQRDLVIFCEFCAKHGIVLLADEVYQKNVYSSSKTFISAKKVAVENKKCHKLQLISFHSTSKGVIGECGRRGGYMELHHIDPFVHNQLYKLASSGLCSNVPGQIMTSLMVSPAKIGDPSHKEFLREEKSIFNSLKRKAAMLVKALNNIEGIECNPAEGAMYVFPRLVNIPEKALVQAKDSGMTIDAFYAMSLLEETGICVVPASGFCQRNGRIGFRTTFLLPDDQMSKAVEKFASHHKLFCKKYA
jgi:alanine transaminase